MKEQIKKISAMFQVIKEYSTQDTRFLKVTVDVLHTGLNYNGSIFTKEVVDDSIETIKNTPILGYIKTDENGVKDFSGHEYDIVETDNGAKEIYLGQAFGVIPESCNPRWITKMSSDGNEREYLQVDGIMWTKFQDASDIMKQDITKGQSMELSLDSIDGTEDENGIFTFNKFAFNGCCLLSTTDEKIEPAMIDSQVVLNYTINDMSKHIKDKLNEFSSIIEQGGSEMQKDFSELVMQNLDTIKTSISEYQTYTDLCGETVAEFEYVDVCNDEVIAFSKKDKKVCGFKLQIANDDIKIDFSQVSDKTILYSDSTETSSLNAVICNHIDYIESCNRLIASQLNEQIENMKTEYTNITDELAAKKSELETLTEQYTTLKTEYDKYIEVEQEKLAEEIKIKKEQEIEKYCIVLADCPEFEELRNNIDNYSLDEIESKCAILYAKKTLGQMKFSKNDNVSLKLGIDIDSESDCLIHTKYGDIPLK